MPDGAVNVLSGSATITTLWPAALVLKVNAMDVALAAAAENEAGGGTAVAKVDGLSVAVLVL